MNKSNITKLADTLSFIIRKINVKINFDISLCTYNDFNNEYKIVKTNNNLPLYSFDTKDDKNEWKTILQFINQTDVYSRIFNEYREFVSVIEKQNMEVYSVAIIHIPIKEYTKIGLDITKSNESSWEKNKRMLTFLDYL